MGCLRCTSLGLSLLTWAATSAWRRALGIKPLSTSMLEVAGCNCLWECILVIKSICECVERQVGGLKSRAVGNCKGEQRKSFGISRCSDREQFVWVGLRKKVLVTLPWKGTVDTVAIS